MAILKEERQILGGIFPWDKKVTNLVFFKIKIFISLLARSVSLIVLDCLLNFN